MSHLQRLAAPLLVVVVLTSVTALVAAPATAQSGVRVFVLVNDTVNDEDRKDRWQMRVVVRPAPGCTPSQGHTEYVSPWIDSGSEVGVSLSLGECVFRISAAIRQAAGASDCRYTAQLSWVPAGNSEPVDGAVYTTSRPTEDVTRLSVVRKPGSGCASPTQIGFFMSSADVVEELPPASTDSDLRALARRAVELSSFDVHVRPDHPSGTVPAGCDDAATLKVLGDGLRVYETLDVLGGGCRFRASVVGAPAPFEVSEGAGVSFTGTGQIVDLSSLVRLRPARIAIIQDVRGSTEGAGVSYTVGRSCGSTEIDPARATDARAALRAGRYTVHSPSRPRFGPAATYPVGAATTDSSEVVGCSVRVAIADVPAGCVVDGAHTRTRTWSESDPVRNFDFEFDITCGTPTPTTTTVGPTGDDPAGTPVATGGEVRVAARTLAGGRVEFALQQRIDGDSWGERMLPARRILPTAAPRERWLWSSPLTIAVAESADDFIEEFDVWIVARRLSSGRIEFGLQLKDGDGTWGERLLPARRFIVADVQVGRWLHSSAQGVRHG